MILPPLNDHACLGPITDILRTLVANRDPDLVALARELGTPAATIRWIRSLPQRDDTGEPGDGPRVEACSPPQRLDLFSGRPNCLERGSIFTVVAEFQDPSATRRLATIDTPLGRHTLPVENNLPVVLDPRVPRNCAQSGIDVLAQAPAPHYLAGCTTWVCRVATEPSHKLPGGPRRLRNAQAALAAMMQGQPVTSKLADDVATVLALAAHEAPQWGPAGVEVVERVAQAVLDLERAVGRCGGRGASARSDDDGAARRNAVELQVGRYRLRPGIPKALGAALRALGVVGLGAGTAVARAKLAMLGVTPGVLGILESELNKDGMTLGSLTKPPPPSHSIAALTKDALVARHLERAGAA